jgi:outer membrane biosynthesis protein TonB
MKKIFDFRVRAVPLAVAGVLAATGGTAALAMTESAPSASRHAAGPVSEQSNLFGRLAEDAESPEPSETPEATEKPKATETPEASEAPSATHTPEATEPPETTSSDDAQGSGEDGQASGGDGQGSDDGGGD